MFRAFACAMIFVASVPAFATSICGINKQSKTNADNYDQNLYYGEVTKSMIVLLKKDGTVVADFNFETDWQRVLNTKDPKVAERLLNGSSVVMFTFQSDDQISIGTQHFDFKQKDNSLPLDVIATGAASKPLLLIDANKQLSLFCEPKP